MCQGLRDAGNLAWKLEAVLRGRAAESLLGSYAIERRPHVVETTRLAQEFGHIISERDVAKARARDAAICLPLLFRWLGRTTWPWLRSMPLPSKVHCTSRNTTACSQSGSQRRVAAARWCAPTTTYSAASRQTMKHAICSTSLHPPCILFHNIQKLRHKQQLPDHTTHPEETTMKMYSLRLALAASLLCAFMLPHVLVQPAAAQDYPNKPIRFIVPAPPGSGPDVDVRQMAPRLGQILGATVVVENRPGAAARIATDAVVKSPADGYTFLVGTPTAVITGPLLYSNLPYDAKRDLTPVSLISTTAFALTVNAAVPAKTAAEYVALAKSNPTYANTGTIGVGVGVGAATHLAGEWFSSVAGANLKFIHYNTSTPYTDLMSGQISAFLDAERAKWGAVVKQANVKIE